MIKKVKNLKKIINEGIEKMFEELKEGKTDIFEKYLNGAAKLRYSSGNLVLIFSQCPQASCLKTFGAWKKAGYMVNKGEKAICILQPIPYYVQKDETDEENLKKKDERIYFKILHLFDITQVTKIDPEAPDVKPNLGINDMLFPTVEGDYEEKYNLLKKIVFSTGIQVEERLFVLDAGVQGASFGGKIVIKKHNYGNMFLVLLHEWAHEILHQGSRMAKQDEECQAEAVAYIVGNALNVHSPYSRDYILGWGNDVEDFKKNLSHVVKASNYILKTIEEYCKNNSASGCVA